MTDTEPTRLATQKLGALLNTVIYSSADIEINIPKSDERFQRNYLRVVQWNLENFDTEYFLASLKDDDNSELQKIKNTDIFTINNSNFYNEKSNFTNQLAKLSKELNAHYLFAPEFIEASPNLLNQNLHFKVKKEIFRELNPYLDDIEPINNRFQDPSQNFKGLKGNAIISKLPIKSARLVRLPACYDWFSSEEEHLRTKEDRKEVKFRAGEGKVKQIRRGGRVALVAELISPNQDLITVVSSQLENRSKPKCRQKQLSTILNNIKYAKGPVVMGIDLNNFGKDTGPQSLKERAKTLVTDPEFLAKQALKTVNPFGLATSVASLTYGNYRKMGNPTVKHIPILLPNKAYGIYKVIKEFNFADKQKFDFSGEHELANSNERKNRRYKQSYEYKGLFGTTGKKVDWIFVKTSFGSDGKEYFPHAPETLSELSFPQDKENQSSHYPISVKIII